MCSFKRNVMTLVENFEMLKEELLLLFASEIFGVRKFSGHRFIGS